MALTPACSSPNPHLPTAVPHLSLSGVANNTHSPGTLQRTGLPMLTFKGIFGLPVALVWNTSYPFRRTHTHTSLAKQKQFRIFPSSASNNWVPGKLLHLCSFICKTRGSMHENHAGLGLHRPCRLMALPPPNGHSRRSFRKVVCHLV